MFISLMFEHDGMPCTAVNYSVGCEISKTHANLPSRGSKITGLFLIFCTAVECEFSKLYFLPQLVFILLSTFVKILNLVWPSISSHQQQPTAAREGGTKLEFKKGKLSPFRPFYNTASAVRARAAAHARTTARCTNCTYVRTAG